MLFLVLAALAVGGAADADYTLGGLFPLTGSLGEAGVQREAAFIMAVQDVNERYPFSMGYVTADTESDAAAGAEAARAIAGGLTGFVGAAKSSTSIAVADVANAHNLPQISYSSTAPVLSDQTQFPNFARVVPSDAKQGQVIADFIELAGWQSVAVIAGSDAYGQGVTDAFLSSHGGGADVVDAGDPVPEGTRIIVLAASADEAREVLDGIGPNNYVWVLTDSTAQSHFVDDLDQSLVIGIRPDIGTGYHHRQFLEQWQECHREGILPGCTGEDPNIYAFYSYDAVLVYAEAISALLEEGRQVNTRNIVSEVRDVGILGATGFVSFDGSGDRHGTYEILFKRGDRLVPVGSWQSTGIVIN